MKINSKEDVIKYFNSGCKNNLSIGVENEKFLFDFISNKNFSFSTPINKLFVQPLLKYFMMSSLELIFI